MATARAKAKPRAKAKAKPKAEQKQKPKPAADSIARVDAYLAKLPAEQRAALEKLRKLIRATVPKAEEHISYALPAFRLDGKVLVGFGASAKHCAFYPMSGSTVAKHAAELEGYETTKGSIHFQPDAPLPAALVRKLIKSRIADNAEG